MFIEPMHAHEETIIIAPSGEVFSIVMTAHRSSRDEPIVGINMPRDYMILRGRYRDRLQQFLDSTLFYQVGEGKEVIAAVSEAQAIQLCQQCYPLQAHPPLVALDDITLLPCYGPVVRSWFNGAALPFSVTTV